MIAMRDRLDSGNRQTKMFSRATAHSSGASSTPVTFSKPYSAARMQARPRPQPRSAKCSVLGKFRSLRSLRKAHALTGAYEVAWRNFERSTDVEERDT